SNQRSWFFAIDRYGYLYFAWSSDGTLAGRIAVQSTTPVPDASGRLTLAVTLDVNNGAAGNTVTFYTSTSTTTNTGA
ncbi:hypothetical protein, partial [Staphylococcus aureus]